MAFRICSEARRGWRERHRFLNQLYRQEAMQTTNSSISTKNETAWTAGIIAVAPNVTRVLLCMR